VDIGARARDLIRPIGWRGDAPDPEHLDGALVFPRDRAVESFDGTRIAYTVLGDRGPWVALVPGFGCSDTFWRLLGPELARDRRVIVWDLRGLGASGYPRRPGYRARNLSTEDFSIESSARDLEAILDGEGAAASSLVGHSLGGQTILEAYRRASHRVSALVFLTAPFESPLRTFYGRDATRAFQAFEASLKLLPRPAILLWRALFLLDPRIPHTLGRAVRAMGPGARVQDMAAYYRHLGGLDPLVMLKMARAMREHSARDVMPTVRVPSLVVAADLDTFCPIGLARIMHESIPGSELHVLEGAGHAAVIEKPDEVNRRVREFLDRNVSPAPTG
jgi:3-oxoadipate enol-lactonase